MPIFLISILETDFFVITLFKENSRSIGLMLLTLFGIEIRNGEPNRQNIGRSLNPPRYVFVIPHVSNLSIKKLENCALKNTNTFS